LRNLRPCSAAYEGVEPGIEVPQISHRKSVEAASMEFVAKLSFGIVPDIKNQHSFIFLEG
jgi:hypothetical protein